MKLYIPWKLPKTKYLVYIVRKKSAVIFHNFLKCFLLLCFHKCKKMKRRKSIPSVDKLSSHPKVEHYTHCWILVVLPCNFQTHICIYVYYSNIQSCVSK